MRVLIVPDSMKESLSAEQAADCISRGIRSIFPYPVLDLCPVADGGEGTVKALIKATQGSIITATVHDPLMREINSFYGVLGDGKTVVIEVAAASGLELLNKSERNPMSTTSLGTGELIAHALDSGYRKFIIGLGGSAVNDCGAGIIKALGAKLQDENKEDIFPSGGKIGKVRHIDLTSMDSRITECDFQVACDVVNPLTGLNGASFVFGPQKGATDEMIQTLDSNLNTFADKLSEATGKDIRNYEGSGAAGGIGAIMLAVFNADLRKGFDLISEASGLEEKIQSADLIITAEGKVDSQTLYGKVPYGISLLGKKYHKPVYIFCGVKGAGAEQLFSVGASGIFQIAGEEINQEDSIRYAASYLEKSVATHMLNILS